MAGDQNLASGNTWWGTNLTAAVLNGTIPQWRLDDMVVRIMSAYYKVCPILHGGKDPDPRRLVEILQEFPSISTHGLWIRTAISIR
jgi:hypothetical protein